VSDNTLAVAITAACPDWRSVASLAFEGRNGNPPPKAGAPVFYPNEAKCLCNARDYLNVHHRRRGDHTQLVTLCAV